MAFGKGGSGTVRRPSRVLLVLLTVCVLPLAVVLALGTTVARPFFGLINGFVSSPSGAAVESAQQASRAITKEVEAEGIVLLENDGVLPLATNAKVNVFGIGSEQFVFGGTGSGAADESKNVRLLDGLRDAGLTVNDELAAWYAENAPELAETGLVGTDWNLYEPATADYPEELLASARDFSGTAIVVFSRRGGEGFDLPKDMAAYEGSEAGRSYLELSPNEEELLAMVERDYQNVIVLVNAANAMELGFVENEAVDAALWVGNPGSTGCDAIGEVLVGAVNPSGRTVDTYPYQVESAPSYYATGEFNYANVTYSNNGAGGDAEVGDNLPYHYVEYVEGIYVGYRYFETAAADGFIDYDATVQYPFGYGLSYTSFEQEITGFKRQGDTVTVQVRATNTGKVAGKDVAQVYVKAPYTKGGIEKSEVELAGFAKTDLLAPGASEVLTVSFDLQDLASYDYRGIKATGGAYVLEAGEYEVRLQANSHDVIESRSLTVAADRIFDDAHDGKRTSDLVTAVNRFDDVSFGDNLTYVSRADWAGTVPTERLASGKEATEEQIAAILTTEAEVLEAEDIVVEQHGIKLADMKGLDYDDPKWDEFMEQLSVSDMNTLVTNGGWMTAPLGKIGKPYVVDSDGPNGVNLIAGNTKGVQFTGQLMLGATWNTDLVYRMGETFGSEAAALGVGGLYAPACNIHRDPFAGRNYEYVSEDGFLSGAVVAAEVRGIQSKGVYTYTKHFALNDQETHRCDGGLVTWANEQAIRELYLRPFEMAVKDGGTLGIMSSFNRIGTTPTAESHALLTEVLRDEWGFRGTVVTDCVMAATTMDFDRALRAGNDLELSFGVVLPSTDKSTTDTPYGHQVLRRASKNILYTTANSNALETATYGPYPVQVGLYAVCGTGLALYALYLVRRHKRMVAWRAQQGA